MSTNVIVVGGRLTRDVQMKRLGEYDLMEGSIAFDVGWGARKHAVFLDFKWWGKGAVALEKYMLKGKGVVITGSYDVDKWKGNDGIEKQKSFITVSNVELGASPQATQEAERPVAQPPEEVIF